MSVCSACDQQLYSFHFRGQLGRFISLADWGLRLDVETVEVEGSSSSESDSTEFESSSSSSVSWAAWAPSVLDGLESDEEQSNPPWNTAYKLYTFSNIMVGENLEKSSITPNIPYAARRDCSATPQAQMMISVQPPPYLEKRKCVNFEKKIIIVLCWARCFQHVLASELLCLVVLHKSLCTYHSAICADSWVVCA